MSSIVLDRSYEIAAREGAEAAQEYLDKFFQGLTERHYGPGPHPGTGTPQTVHAGQDGDLARAAETIRRMSAIRSIDDIETITNYWSLSMSDKLGRRVHVHFGEFDSGVHGLLAEDDQGNVLKIQTAEATADDGNREQVLTYIEANNKGTGLGTAFMETMRSYADLRGIRFRIAFVSNPAFYQRFDWLRRAETGWEAPFEEYRNYLYEPK